MPSLVISGATQGENRLDWDEVAALPGRVEDAGSVAKGAFGKAVPLASVVERARPKPGVHYCTVISSDGSYRASIPLDELTNDGWLAFGSGEDPLPDERGGPFRLSVARGRTLCWNVKHVGELRFTAEKEADDVPARPPH